MSTQKRVEKIVRGQKYLHQRKDIEGQRCVVNGGQE